MQVFTSRHYDRKVGKLDAKLYKKVRECLALFLEDPQVPILNNHALHGKRKHQRSINITGDRRLIYEPVDGNTVRLIDIDTHANLYE